MTTPTRATAAGRAYLDLRRKARQDRRPVDELMQLYVLECFLARPPGRDPCAAYRPVSARFENGFAVTGRHPLIRSRCTFWPRSTSPRRLAVPARPAFVRGRLPPAPASPGTSCPPSFTRPLRRPGGEGLPPPLDRHGASWRTVPSRNKHSPPSGSHSPTAAHAPRAPAPRSSSGPPSSCPAGPRNRLGLAHPVAERLRINAQLPADLCDRTPTATRFRTQFQDHLHGPFPQLSGECLPRYHEPQPSQRSRPPRKPGRSRSPTPRKPRCTGRRRSWSGPTESSTSPRSPRSGCRPRRRCKRRSRSPLPPTGRRARWWATGRRRRWRARRRSCRCRPGVRLAADRDDA